MRIIVSSLTGIRIPAGVRVALTPLLPSPDMQVNTKAVIVPSVQFNADSIEYFFSSFSLPIIGTLNEEGRMVSIEEDSNTHAIEQFFNCTIQQFVDCVMGVNREIQCADLSVLCSLSAMVERYEVHEYLVRTIDDHSLKSLFNEAYQELVEALAEYFSNEQSEEDLTDPFADSGLTLHPHIENWVYFENLYERLIETDDQDFRMAFIRFLLFKHAVLCCNRLLWPGYHSDYDGDPGVLEGLQQVASGLEPHVQSS